MQVPAVLPTVVNIFLPFTTQDITFNCTVTIIPQFCRKRESKSDLDSTETRTDRPVRALAQTEEKSNQMLLE